MLKFPYNTKDKYLNISKLKLNLKKFFKIFFLKVWAKNVGVHYTRQKYGITQLPT